jgi:hypothetical protein
MARNQRRRTSDIPSEVKLRKVVSEVPWSETERGELLEDLQTMGCSGLLEKPWGFKNDRMWEHHAPREFLTFPTFHFRRRSVDFRQWRN